MKNSPVIPYIMLTLCALFWAGSSVVGRHVAGEIPPLALNFWRWLFAFLIVLTWTSGELWRHRQLVLQKWKYISFLALSSAIGFGALHYVALQYTTAINGALFQGLMSICILITALIILGDRFGVREGIGVVLGFTGVAVIVTRGDVNVLFGLTFNIGDIILFLATMSYSVYAVFLRRAPAELSSSALMAGMFGFAALYMLPLWLVELYVFDRSVPMNFTAVWSIGFMTLGPSVLAQIFWAYSVSRVGPGTAGYFIYLAPVFGVVLATSLLGEQFYMFHAAGIVLIFTGIWLATRKQA
ncbi:MAG: DMT family transporter [Rhodospirillaceae bacterium]|nr:MAG: DMT family transporter [Rhodospirillaceae bacterium]